MASVMTNLHENPGFIGWIAFCLVLILSSGLCSRITFENGVYSNILVALHPETDHRNCVELVSNISVSYLGFYFMNNECHCFCVCC